MTESIVLKSPRNECGGDQDTSICRYCSKEVREWYIRMAHVLRRVRGCSEALRSGGG